MLNGQRDQINNTVLQKKRSLNHKATENLQTNFSSPLFVCICSEQEQHRAPIPQTLMCRGSLRYTGWKHLYRRGGVTKVWLSPRLASKLRLPEAMCCRERVHRASGISCLPFYLENGVNCSVFTFVFEYTKVVILVCSRDFFWSLFILSFLDTTTTFLPYLRCINLQELLVDQYTNSVVAERKMECK